VVVVLSGTISGRVRPKVARLVSSSKREMTAYRYAMAVGGKNGFYPQAAER